MQSEQFQVTVIIPALNESASIVSVIKGVLAQEKRMGCSVAVLVVDDGSTDRTGALARAAGAQVVTHPVNRGVGAAFQTGMEHALRAGADIIVNIDADGQFDPQRIPEIVTPILQGSAGFVTASRFKEKACYPDMPRIKFAGNLLMSRLVSKIVGQHFYDVSCGFRAYSREAALQLNLWGDFTYTQETFLDLAVKGVVIEEVPMLIRGEREHGKSRVASNLWRYGRKTLAIILHSLRDYWPMHFFGLLSCVFLVPGIALGAFLLVHRFRSGVFTPHIWAGFVGGALVFLGLLTLVVAMLGEMLKRIRLNQERMLYLQKNDQYGPRIR
jgi:glycosyltransferase involved in cell wall biosynthesis